MREASKPVALSEQLLLGVGGAYLVTLFIAGFLTNFFSLGTINSGTILLYFLAGLLSVIGMLYLVNPLKKEIALIIILILALSLLSVVKSLLDTNPSGDRVRELAIFFLGVWPFFFFVQISNFKVRQRLYRILALGLVGLAVFGIFQGIFANNLPNNLFVLRGDTTFTLYGVDTLRPTGLTGNPIVFSSMTVFASAYFAALWLETRRAKFFWAITFSLVANYLTYTRASIVLVIPVLFFVWLIHKRLHIKHKFALIATVVVAIGVVQFALVNGGNVIMVQRLQNSSPSDIASTLGHVEQIRNAGNAILSHPWLGTGMGSNSTFIGPENAIITDGAWWILFLEFGAPLSILIVVSLFIFLIILTKGVLREKSTDRALAIATLSFHAYLIPANFIDSAILGHISFGLYWVVLGLSFAGLRSGLNRPVLKHSHPHESGDGTTSARTMLSGA